MSEPGHAPEHPPEPEGRYARLVHRWRRNFLTGLVLVLPLYLTVSIISSGVFYIDRKVETLLPGVPHIERVVGVPGYGLLLFVVFTAMLGALARNVVAAQAIGWGERLLDRLPIVRSIYNGIKQIAETVFAPSQSSFEKACLIEYPRKGLWAIAFISTKTRGEVQDRTGEGAMMSVFLPTTPNPTSGFLLFVPREDVIELDMTVEEAAKLVISAGLVTPPTKAQKEAAKLPKPLPPAVRPAAE